MEKYFCFDRTKTLEELDKEDWGNPSFDSHLVETCHNLRMKPLLDFTVEDLRIMIGQNLYLEYLVPLSIEILDDDLMVMGDLYKGDLFEALLNVESKFWEKNLQLKQDFKNIITKNISYLQEKLDSFQKNK